MARIVVAGAGAMGASIAYHLAELGADDVVLCDVAGVAAGATVNLRATTVDGTRTYSKNNVTLSSMYDWRLP